LKNKSNIGMDRPFRDPSGAEPAVIGYERMGGAPGMTLDAKKIPGEPLSFFVMNDARAKASLVMT